MSVEDFKARRRLKYIEVEMATCKHFNGIQHPACKAGVDYKAVRDGSHQGMYRWPCITHDGRSASTTCAKKECPTREEAEAAEVQRETAIAAYLDKLRSGICGVCNKQPTDFVQVGSCIYAEPCGHRVGQGNAKKYKAGLRSHKAAP